jgi:high-affinity iron transporter
VVVAAGLLMTAAHTAGEAGWLTVGQAQALDLSWLVRPGTPLSSLITGVLGIQPFPAQVEVIAYLVYLVPMVLVIAIPPQRRPAPASTAAPSSTAATPAISTSPDSALTQGHAISASENSSGTARPTASPDQAPGRRA